MKTLRIWWLKRRLRVAYLKYTSQLDRQHCGRHMADQLPSVAAQKTRCNNLLQKLKSLDPSLAHLSIR